VPLNRGGSLNMQQRQLANAIRFLSMDAVQKANSGHPGMPMGMADIAEVLWRKYLNHNPKNPNWYDRDRFVLSNGHGSMLLYSLLHLSGYELSIEDIKNFRQFHSKTPGHPEYGYAPGIETTTGPLGQGIANAVGMALAEKLLAIEFNKPDAKIVDHYIYSFLGDGCLMEGISHEVCSLAGTLGLGKLVLFWDDNSISIDGKVDGWFTEDVPARFKAYNWHVVADVDGHDANAIDKAIQEAQANTDQPTLICCKTSIGFGSPNKADTASAHGAPLGDEEIALTRETLGWKYPAFEIPNDIYKEWNATEKGQKLENRWNDTFASYKISYPIESAEFIRRMKHDLPECWNDAMQEEFKKLVKNMPKVASRKASQMALESICQIVPEMFGGSADLTGSTLTNWSGTKWINHHSEGNYLSYGVREFGMAAMMNGMALHGGYRPYGGTFLVFSDYARNAMRMSAIIGLPVVYVMTHDSIGVGGDGPTHQPVEHVPSLRLIPNMNVWRPADAFETQVAWKVACEEQKTPSVLALSRQGLPAVVDDMNLLPQIEKGGYVLKDVQNAEIVLAATGSEVELMLEAAKVLASKNINARVVSLPCADIFMQQSDAYKTEVLLSEVPIIIAEASSTGLWYSLIRNRKGSVIGLDHFGESAPADELFEAFGFTVDNVVENAQNLL
jgi:transketolase